MRHDFPSSALKIILASSVLVSATFLAPAVSAQLRLGGSRPAALAPRGSMPLEVENGAQEKRKPAPAKPALNLTLVDPGPIGAETTTNLYFAQVAVGGGYTTVFTLINTGGTAVNGTLFLTGQDGTPFTVNLNEPSINPELGGSGVIQATGSSFPLQPIPPGGTRILTATPANPGDPTKSGWARVENIGGSLGGVGTFQQTVGGVLQTIAGVLSSQPVPFATIPVDNSDAEQRFTGFAVANQNASSLSVRLVTLNENGQIQDNLIPSQLNLGTQTQTAIFLHQILPARVTFRGSMVLVGQGGQSFAVVALVLNRGLLTAIPVIPEKAPNVPN